MKNEYDIAEAFVLHTLAFLDMLVVLDNGSTDGTRKLLCGLGDRFGARIEIVDDPSPGDWQWKRMTRLMKEFAIGRYDADWIVCLDADEFIVAESPSCFRRALSSASSLASLEWRTYVPYIEDNMQEINPVLRMRHHLAEEPARYFKVIVPGSLGTRVGTQIGMGNHEVLMEERSLEMAPLGSVRLAHFPIRDPLQYMSKIVLTTLQFAAMFEKNPSCGDHIRQYWETLKEDPQKIAEDFREAAKRYGVGLGAEVRTKPLVLDPLAYRGGSLTATVRQQNSNRFVSNILNYAESLATSYATLQRDHTDLVARYTTLQRDRERLVSSKAYRLSLIVRSIWVRLRRIFRHF